MDLSNEALLNTDDAARLLGMTSGNLAVKRSQGKGPKFVKIGYRVLYRLEDLLEYKRKTLAVPTTVRVAS